MKSKSFHLGQGSGDKHSDNKFMQNKTFDFINLYKSAADTSTSWTEKHTHNGTEKSLSKTERSPHRQKKKEKREPVEITHLNIEGPHLNDGVGDSTPRDEFKVTSTPIGICRNQKSPKVKSIMKVASSPGLTDDGSILDVSNSKSKKRNKSVSFLLEDNEETTIKKTKSDASNIVVKSSPLTFKTKKHLKKAKKTHDEKEKNKIKVNMSIDNAENVGKKSMSNSEKENSSESVSSLTETENNTQSKKKRKHLNKVKKLEDNESGDTNSEPGPPVEKVKKIKKKKRQEKHNDTESEEPAAKSRKEDDKPDVITDLENLSIGDNAHTLSNLLDEMTVVNKEKRKKLKPKKKPNPNVPTKEDSEKENGVEKKKWKKKWNKEGKADVVDNLENTVIVKNLPISILFTYKKTLAEHFAKYGLIKSVGIAEMYPTEELHPVFTTTIHFYSDGAAKESLQEDKTIFEGSTIRVQPTLPPTETTLVIRSYGPLTPQYISSEFNAAGRIRNIRQLVKGKHSMATFFIEFDGRKSSERALQLATDIKIGGKKVHVSRFEPRRKPKPITNDNQPHEADNEDFS